MEKWFIRNKKSNCSVDLTKFNIDEILYKILVNRGIESEDQLEEFIEADLSHMHSPILLKDLIKGANIVLNNIKLKNSIRIVGDYDVDGIMSTYILYRGLENLGATVDYHIPHRVNDGYGINKDIVDKACADGITLLITCDNGIAAFEVISYAIDKGLQVIVTDHHNIPIDTSSGEELVVCANAVINPKLSKCKYPYKDLCGAGVAYKLINYLYDINGISREDLNEQFLPFLTIATICDVMPIIGENRIIVKFGLDAIKNSRNFGLRALIETSGLSDAEIGVYHVGFVIGPSINSSGRLKSAKEGLELFLAQDSEEAKNIAENLRGLNATRQNYTNEGLQRAINILENSSIKDDKIIVILDENTHESIAGIIAGKIKEKYNKPTILLTKGKDGIKGSGRSIDKYNMFEEISRLKNLLIHFGGHSMAAGLSLREDNLELLRSKLNQNTILTEDDLIKEIYIDSPLNFSNITMEFINSLKILEPYGNKNPQPLFGTKNLFINRAEILGKNRNVLKLHLTDGIFNFQGISFEDPNIFLEAINNKYTRNEIENLFAGKSNDLKIDIIYSLEINEFRGNKSIQLKIKSYRLSR